MSAALEFPCLVATALLLWTQDAGSGSAQDRKPELQKEIVRSTFHTILKWLPTDTETLVVTNGPYQIEAQDENNRRPGLSLMRGLEALSYGPLGNPRNGLYLKKLDGQKVALGVEGARAFRSPKGLGLSPYEGCHILIFSRGLGSNGRALRKAWAADALKVQKVEGHDVYLFQEKLEEDIWKLYFAQPVENVVVCATDEAYLSELLKRMARPGGKRALPDNLPEWKQVDTNARWWAIRHYINQRVLDADAPLAVDPKAVGVTFSYTPTPEKDGKSSVHINYFSASTQARNIARKYFDQGKWRPIIRQSTPGVIEFTGEVKGQNVEEIWMLLLWHLGHSFAV